MKAGFAQSCVLWSIAWASSWAPTGHCFTVAEALNATNLTWRAYASVQPWWVVTNITHDGVAATGFTNDNIMPIDASLETTVTGPTAIAFWWKTSCWTNDATFLGFYCSGVLLARISGEAEWEQRTFFVPDGPQTLRWRYTANTVSSAFLNSAWLDEVTLCDPTPPTIRPFQDQTALAGDTVVFAPEIGGTEPWGIQWRLNGQDLVGATSRVLKIQNAQESNQGYYDISLQTPLGSVTNGASLSVTPSAPRITLKPASSLNVLGDTRIIQAAAAGTEPMSWQWYHNGQLVDSVTGPNFNIAPVGVEDAGDYLVVVSNQIGWATSQVAHLTVCLEPFFTWQPISMACPTGAMAQFSAQAMGSATIGWQWFHNGSALSGEFSDSLSIPNVNAGDYGDYSLVATNAFGTSTSAVVHLTYGPVWTWGVSGWQRIQQVPSAATNLLNISGGDSHVLALRADSTLLAWGNNYFGQLDVPASVSKVTGIVAGGNHSAVIQPDGSVVAWGRMDHLRSATMMDGWTPTGEADVTPPEEATNIVALAGGGGAEHILALRADGVPVSWGDTNFGLCRIPAEASNIVSIAVGTTHSLVLREDGRVLTWGYSGSGLASVPQAASNVVALAAGDGFSLALRADGTVVAWGDSKLRRTNVPPAATNVIMIACGSDYAVALRRDGTVVAWGDNRYGWPISVPSAATNLCDLTSFVWGGLGLIGEGAPLISQQPLSTPACAGDTFRFIGKAVGAVPLAYQWYRDGVPIATGSDPWLLLDNVQKTSGENYYLVVTNMFGSVTSRVAQITRVFGAVGEPQVARLANGQLEISWSAGYLQAAEDINGPWVSVADAKSPLTLDPQGRARFFRVSSQSR